MASKTTKQKPQKPSKQKGNKPILREISVEEVVSALAYDMDPDRRSLLTRYMLKVQNEAAFRVIGLLTVMLTTSIVFIMAMSMYASSNKEFYNISQDGKIQQARTIHAKDIHFSRAQISEWTSDTLIDAFSFSFRNAAVVIDEVTRERFTEEGAIEYGKAIADLKQQVEESKGVLSIEFEGKTKYYGKRKTSGSGQIWQMSKPVRLVLDRPNKPTLELKSNAILTIVRVDDWENEKGLAVSRIVLKKDSGK